MSKKKNEKVEEIIKEISEWKGERVNTMPEDKDVTDGVKEGWNSFGTKLLEYLNKI